MNRGIQSLKSLFYCCLLVAITVYRGWPALSKDNMGLSASFGDGLGTMAWIYSIHEYATKMGWWPLLKSDYFNNIYVGAGQNDGAWIFLPWRIIYGGLGYFFEPNQVYDVIGVGGISLTGLATYWLLRTQNLSRLNSFFCSLVVMSIANNGIRLGGHLTLSFFFAQIFVIDCLLRWLREFRLRWAVLLVVTSALSISMNEYYAFYGGLFTIILGTTYILLTKKMSDFLSARVLGHIFGMCVGLMLLLLLLFNGMFLDSVQVVSNRVSVIEYNHYSLGDPLKLFYSSWADKYYSLPKIGTLENSGEMTFRIGFFVIALFIILFVIDMFRKNRIVIKPFFVSLFLASIGSLLIALPTTSDPHLSEKVIKIFPMFRVIVRSVLFFDLGLIIMLYVLIQNICNFRYKNFLVALVTIVILYDFAPNSPLFAHFQSYELPKSSAALRKLESEPDGLLAEIPLVKREVPPEVESEIAYRRIFHKKPIFNIVRAMIPSSFQSEHDRIASFQVEKPETLIEELRKKNVRYLLVNKSHREIYINRDSLQFLEEDPQFSAFRILN